MLSQNTAIILSTLLGGTLTIIGGFIATYSNLRIMGKKEKRKELRNIFEQIYRSTYQIKTLYQYIIMQFKATQLNSPEKIFDKDEHAELNTHLETIRMLVGLYIPELQKSLMDYVSGLVEIQNILSRDTQNKESFDTEAMRQIEITNTIFQAAIVRLVQKKGYSYL